MTGGIESSTVEDWLDRLAARTPTPGGGAAAGLLAATAGALLGMVAIYTTGPRWREREKRMLELSGELAQLRGEALRQVDADVSAFEAVAVARRQPNETPEEKAARTQAMLRAIQMAAEPPVAVGRLAARLVEVAADLADSGNPNVVSDVAVAAAAARAALEAAIVNIAINRRQIPAGPETSRLDREIEDIERALAGAELVASRVRDGLR